MTHTLDMLSSYFQMRERQVTSAWLLPLIVPGIVGFWSSPSDNAKNWHDVISGKSLTDHGSPTVGIATSAPGLLVPYWTFDGSSDYFSRNDETALSIVGDITVAAWVRWDDFDVTEGIVNKWETSGGNNRSYALYSDASNQLNFAISEDGGVANMATATYGTALSAETWYFAQGRFDMNSLVGARVDNGTWGTTSAAGLTAIDDNGSDFRIAEYNETAGNRFDGRIAQVWLSCYYVPSEVLDYIYAEQAAFFGKS